MASLCFHYTELAWPKVTEAAPTDVEEERRLFYVGVTRAKELLYLSRPERRTMRGRVTPRVGDGHHVVGADGMRIMYGW